jgi:hypothetical protein
VKRRNVVERRSRKRIGSWCQREEWWIEGAKKEKDCEREMHGRWEDWRKRDGLWEGEVCWMREVKKEKDCEKKMRGGWEDWKKGMDCEKEKYGGWDVRRNGSMKRRISVVDLKRD